MKNKYRVAIRFTDNNWSYKIIKSDFLPLKFSSLTLGFSIISVLVPPEILYFNNIWSTNILRHIVRKSNRYMLEVPTAQSIVKNDPYWI